MEITYEVLLLLMLLAGAAALQFFRGRKLNMMLMEHYLKAIEPFLRPYRDRNFTLIGGYVGFKAEYQIFRDNIKVLEYTLTLLPRQSLLYFPISLLTSRHDKLYVVVRPYSEITRGIHAIQRGYYRVRPKIEDEAILDKATRTINGVTFEVLYEREKDAELIVDLLKSFPRVKDVKHISLTRSTNVVYVLMRPRPEDIRDSIRAIISFVNTRLSEHFKGS